MPTSRDRRKEETKNDEYIITYTRHLEKRLRNLETEKQLLDAERVRLEQELHSLKNVVEDLREKERKLLNIEKIKKEKEQQIFFNLLGDKAIIDRLNNVANVSTQIRLDMLRNILNIKIENKEYFDSKIFEWAYEYGFRIDGDFLVFEKDAMKKFIISLEKEFEDWYNNEKGEIVKKK